MSSTWFILTTLRHKLKAVQVVSDYRRSDYRSFRLSEFPIICADFRPPRIKIFENCPYLENKTPVFPRLARYAMHAGAAVRQTS